MYPSLKSRDLFGSSMVVSEKGHSIDLFTDGLLEMIILIILK